MNNLHYFISIILHYTFKWCREDYLASTPFTHRGKAIAFHIVDNYWYNVYFFPLNNCIFPFVTSAQDRLIKVH